MAITMLVTTVLKGGTTAQAISRYTLKITKRRYYLELLSSKS
jgi:hypothetical protein